MCVCVVNKCHSNYLELLCCRFHPFAVGAPGSLLVLLLSLGLYRILYLSLPLRRREDISSNNNDFSSAAERRRRRRRKEERETNGNYNKRDVNETRERRIKGPNTRARFPAFLCFLHLLLSCRARSPILGDWLTESLPLIGLCRCAALRNSSGR